MNEMVRPRMIHPLEYRKIIDAWQKSDKTLRFGQYFIVQLYRMAKDADSPLTEDFSDPDLFYESDTKTAIKKAAEYCIKW